MRDDELYAKKVFAEFLHTKKSEGISWRDGNQNTAPDFFLSVGNQEFIVEVTTISTKINSREDSGENETREYLQIKRTEEDFIEEVQQEALAQHILSGKYLVQLSSSTREVIHSSRNLLKEQILRFLSETRSQSYIDASPIYLKDHCEEMIPGNKLNQPCLYIRKKAECDSSIIGSIKIEIYGVYTEWEGQIRKELCAQLNERVSNKTKKLRHLEQSKILLLLNRNIFCSLEDYQRCIGSLDLSGFHSVFVVSSEQNQNGIMLHTCREDWK